MPDVQVDFAPARWWEAIDFLRLNLKIVQGHDPWADRVLARPWSLFSLREYAYMLDNFFRSSTFFIIASGQRAGLISMKHRPGFIYIDSLGLLTPFIRKRIGKLAADFVEDYARRKGYRWGVATMAVGNKPVHMLCGAFGGRLLGLSTTTLALTTVSPSLSTSNEFELKELGRPEARKAWKRWRLLEVEHAAGRDAVEIAVHLLESLPRGKHLSIHQNGQEIGFAFARQRAGESEISVFTSNEFWSDTQTANIVTAIACHLESTIRRLTLTQTHANVLTGSESFSFERHRDQERHLVVFKQT